MEKNEEFSAVFGKEYEALMDREKRKTYGSFYTPDFIINYIIENTIMNLDILENPFIKIIDPACGVGYFLIKAYEILMDKFAEKIHLIKEKYLDEEYSIEVSGKLENIKGEKYWRKENLHYHILKHCIYGADIDSKAVHFTKTNLISKKKENLGLEPNIVCCDSLLKWEEDYKWREIKKIDVETFLCKYDDIDGIQKEKKVSIDEFNNLMNICKFWSQKYDYIIGNPPWVSLSRKHKRDIEDQLMNYYISRYDGNKFLPNLYEYFIRRALFLVKENGKIGFVVPDRFGKNLQYKPLRKELLENYNILNLAFEVDFPNINTDTMIFIIENSHRQNNQIKMKVYNERDYLFYQEEYLRNTNYEFFYENNSEYMNIKKRIEKDSKLIGDISTTFTGFIGENKKVTKDKTSTLQVEILKGENISRFSAINKFYYEFTPQNIKGGTKDIRKLAMPYKIIVRKTGKKIIAALDTKGYIVEQSLYGIINLSQEFSYKYVLAILNSKLIEWYYLNFLITNINSTPQIKKYSLNKIPIKYCDKEKQKEIEAIVDKIILKIENLKKSNSIELIKIDKNIKKLQRKLDERIFSLYEVDYNEITKKSSSS
ncbi:type IIS restriction enzyme Eco57I [Clostridium magnum DSM 2767]|uniref:site-specific DNA-methyltransferase (adenine-specific) n=2 Tax=Clostridium magnum TaxID=33954 RepID=A0A161YSB1_9CLOT|nr:type IIS restriction enzyme Eco57I [Clostridium magnum DSM 2767]SHH98459.1 N-6 DNA Methylase [Clostridium magnum DSM 2767]